MSRGHGRIERALLAVLDATGRVGARMAGERPLTLLEAFLARGMRREDFEVLNEKTPGTSRFNEQGDLVYLSRGGRPTLAAIAAWERYTAVAGLILAEWKAGMLVLWGRHPNLAAPLRPINVVSAAVNGRTALQLLPWLDQIKTGNTLWHDVMVAGSHGARDVGATESRADVAHMSLARLLDRPSLRQQNEVIARKWVDGLRAEGKTDDDILLQAWGAALGLKLPGKWKDPQTPRKRFVRAVETVLAMHVFPPAR